MYGLTYFDIGILFSSLLGIYLALATESIYRFKVVRMFFALASFSVAMAMYFSADPVKPDQFLDEVYIAMVVICWLAFFVLWLEDMGKRSYKDATT